MIPYPRVIDVSDIRSKLLFISELSENKYEDMWEDAAHFASKYGLYVQILFE